MGRKRYKRDFVDLRGRWIDNEKLVRKIIDKAKAGDDWTSLLKPILMEDSFKTVEKIKGFQYPPDLRHANFNDLDLENANFCNVNMAKATLFRSDSNSIKVTNSIASDSRWNKSKLQHSLFENCDLNHSNFSNADLHDATFINCKMNHVYFRNANLTKSHFINCDLRHSNLNEVLIDEATFKNVKLYGASLWELKYNSLNANKIDLSRRGNQEIITDDIRFAPLIYLLEDNKLVEIINTLKSNTVVILGADSQLEKKSLLEEIAKKSREFGYSPIIVKNLKEIDGESFTKKAIMYSLIAKFVIIENSYPSGHILEFNKVLDLGCIVGVLQKKGTGSTWLLEENFLKYPFHLKRFIYDNDLDVQTSKTYKWCIGQHGKIKDKLDKLYKDLNLNKT